MHTKPVEQLVKPGPVLPSTGALSNQRGVRGKDDSLLHSAVPLATYLTIVELQDTRQKVKAVVTPNISIAYLI